MIFRSIQRRSVWKEPADEIVAVEFQDRVTGRTDLRPSVYEIDAQRVVRIAAEHSATAGLRPTKKGLAYVDLRNGAGASVADTPTDPQRFEFASDAHRELVFGSEADLRAFIANRQPLVTGKTPQWGVLDYVVERHRQGDDEWGAFLQSPEGAGWATKCSEREASLRASPEPT